MADRKDFDLFMQDTKIAFLEKKIHDFESGEVYRGLIEEIAKLRCDNEMLVRDSAKLESIRRIVE